jgi:hypothetical protein
LRGSAAAEDQGSIDQGDSRRAGVEGEQGEDDDALKGVAGNESSVGKGGVPS